MHARTRRALVALFLVYAGLIPVAFAEGHASFLRRGAAVSQDFLDGLREVFSERVAVMEPRLRLVEDVVRSDFEASVVNSEGKLPVEAIRPLVRSYFARHHGWRLQGLERTPLEHGGKGFVHILQHGAPEFAKLLKQRESASEGLSLGDTSATVLAFEWIVLRRSLELLDYSYGLNSLSREGALGEEALHSVLQSYLIIFRQGSKANLQDPARHQKMRLRAQGYDSWDDLVEFEAGTVTNHRRQNAGDDYSYREVQDIVLQLALAYGRWQDQECRSMKDTLKDLDRTGAGLVHFEAFSAFEGDPRFGYKFKESTDYLKLVGALDVSDKNQSVVIANYLEGPSNCIASSAYVAVCCVSICDQRLAELERQVRGKTAKPERVLQLVNELHFLSPLDATENAEDAAVLDASTVGASVLMRREASVQSDSQQATDTRASAYLESELTELAEASNGVVALRSEAFAQWMHKALPYDCPRPVDFEGDITEMTMRNHDASSRLTPLYMV